MIEPKQEDIDRNKRSFTDLYIQEGQNIGRFIETISESMAYQQALVCDYKERELEGIREERKQHGAT